MTDQALPTADEAFGVEPPKPLPTAAEAFGQESNEHTLYPAVGQIMSAFTTATSEAYKAQVHEAYQATAAQAAADEGHPVRQAFDRWMIEPAATLFNSVSFPVMAAFSGATAALNVAGQPVTQKVEQLGKATGGMIGGPGFELGTTLLQDLPMATGMQGLGVFSGIPHLPEPALAARAADAVGVPESVYMGTQERTPQQAADAQTAAASLPEKTINEEPTREATPPDIHQVARAIAPQTFDEYDRLQAQRDNYSQWIRDLTEKRQQDAEANSPYAEDIAATQAKMEDASPRQQKILQGKLDDLTARHDEWVASETAKDTPDLAQVREAYGKADYRMRDLAPEVSAAYRTAQEHMPEIPEQPQQEPTQERPQEPPETPEPAVETPATAVSPPEPSRTTEQQHTAIVDDIVKQATAAGYKAEEAKASAELLARQYRYLAETYGGKKGTAEELYAKEKPQIIGHGFQLRGKRAKELAQNEAYKAKDYEIGNQATTKQIYQHPQVQGDYGLSVTSYADGERQVATIEIPETAQGNGIAQQLYLKALQDGDLLIRPQFRSETAKRVYDALIRKGLAKIVERDGKKYLTLTDARILKQSTQGKYHLLDDGRRFIRLMKSADASTLIHEGAHHFLDMMKRFEAEEDAPQKLKDDMKTVRDWLDAKEGDELTTRQEERFARGFERYVMEGHAPTKALIPVFQRFQGWLMSIYKTVKGIPNSEISASIRDFFDRVIEPNADLRNNPRHAVIAPEREPGAMLAGIHETDAETTPPEQADAIGDRVAQEVDDTAKLHEPEIADGLNAKTAGITAETPEPATDGGAGQSAGAGGAAQAPATLAKGGNQAKGESAYARIPRKPLSLADWVRKNGGIKDEGGDIRHILGGENGNRVIRPKAGKNADDLALAAQEAGYFPPGERPSVNDFLDKLAEDLKGNAQYSLHDADAVQTYHDALRHNAEVDRLADELGIDAKRMTHGQFWDTVAEKMSAAEQVKTIAAQDEASNAAFEEAQRKEKEWLASRGEAWEPENTNTRTLEDLENERQQEESARTAQPISASAGEAGPAAGNTEPVQTGGGQGGRGPEPTGRAGAAGKSAGQPASPHARFSASKHGLVDKAGNIRLDLLNTTEDIDDAIREVAGENGGFMANRRGVITNGQALDMADALGLDPAQIDFRKIGEANNAETIAAKVKLLIQAAQETSDAAKSGNVEAYLEAKERQKMIQGHVSGITAEAGRALQIFQALKKIEGYDQAKALSDFLAQNDKGKTFNQLEQEMNFAAKLQTPQQLAKFMQDSKGSKFKDAILFYYVNALLSGPITHARYAVGNAVNALWAPLVETPIAAAYGKLSGAADRVHFGEAGAQLYALGKGSRDGLTAAIESFKTGMLPDKANKQLGFAFRQNAGETPIPGIAGKVIGLPTRGVQAIHAFFYTLRYEQNIAAQAYRQAMKEGLDGANFEGRIAELTTRPTEQMVESASGDALKELYMAPTDYHSAMGALTRFTNTSLPAKIILPFMKVGSQITRNAFLERTPLGGFSKDIRANLLGVNGEAARNMQMAKMTSGMALIGATVLAASEGNMTGDGPEDPKQRATWLLTHHPNSMTIGNITIPYQGLGSLGMLMRFSANMYETAHYWNGEDGSKLAEAGFNGITKSVLDDNFLRGAKDALDAIYHPQYRARYLRDATTNWLPFSVGMSQIAREIDPYHREVHSIFDAARAKIPFASESLMPKRDMFGEPIRNGSTYDQYKHDPVVQRLQALHTGIGPLPRRINNVPLTDRQYDDYSRLAGKMTKMMLNNLIQPGFEFAPPHVQIGLIDKTIEHARETARNMVKFNPANSNIIQQAVINKQSLFKQ